MEKQTKNFGEVMKSYIKPYSSTLIFALIFAILGNIPTIIGPNRLSKVTNLITAGLRGKIDLKQITSIVIFLAVIYVIGAAFSYAQGFIMATGTQKFTKDLREKISLKINKLPLSYFDKHDEGDTLSRITNDLDTFGQAINQSLGALISSVVLLVGTIAMMIYTNWILSLTAIVSSLLGFAITIFLLAHSQKYFAAQQNRLADVSGYVEEIYTGHEVVKTYNNTNRVKKRFNLLNGQLFDAVWKAQFISGIMQPLMGFIGNFGYVMVSVVGSVLVLNGHISIGVVVAFMIYVRIFTQPLSQITQAFASLQTAQAGLKRVLEFVTEDEADDREDVTPLPEKVQGKIDFDHVSFGYNERTTVIKDFSAHVKPGQKVAIVGPTGSGKTTLISVLMNFYNFDKGTIKIDDVDVKQLSSGSIRNQFDMVLQDTWLFEDTIMNNLKYNGENVSDEQVIDAAKAVGVDHFIRTLPKGYDTILDDTVTLSVGQKQLMTIARALVRNRPILILDEATSSVDTRTEEQLQKAMDLLTKGRTSLVIAHRLSTIKNADNILVLKSGEIIESGTHDELMDANGFYANMYNSQFESLTA